MSFSILRSFKIDVKIDSHLRSFHNTFAQNGEYLFVIYWFNNVRFCTIRTQVLFGEELLYKVLAFGKTGNKATFFTRDLLLFFSSLKLASFFTPFDFIWLRYEWQKGSLGVVHKWRHAIFDNFWHPLPPSSRCLLLRL
jgi:hypothetical protein